LIWGVVRNGARRWLVFGPISVQPSEFAKFALVVFLAWWLEHSHRKVRGKLHSQIRHPWHGFGLPLVVTAVFAGLIVAQPDLGTTLLLFGVATVLLWIAGSNPVCLGSWIGFVTAAGTALMVAILKFGFLNHVNQVKRIIAWWTGNDPLGLNWQQWQALLAFGSGGPWGLGLGESRQKMLYVPEAHTDFILPIIGEELGVIATLAMVAAFCAVVVCGVLLATKASDLFGLLLGVGIVAVLSLQAIINIAVVTNSIPNKGMPLPFISYGGSNLVMLLAAVGMLVNIYRHALAQAEGQLFVPGKGAAPVAV
jgi:cell division protein FtsW